MNRKFFNNVLKVLMSNMLIIISGVVSGFILPKLLGVTDYGFYKIFNLYITYVVFFDIGISNGVYLFYGGYEVDKLPKEKFRLYSSILFKIQFLAMIVLIIIAITIMKDEYKFIFIMVGIYAFSNNIATYFEKISIMTGEFNAIVRRNVLKSILTVVIVFFLWLFIRTGIPVAYFKVYTVLFVILYTILALQYVIHYRKLILGEKTTLSKEQKKELIQIIKSGFLLLLADMVANLILTLDRQFISFLYDIDIYSIYSFAYSMLRIVILAISPIASVLYPTLKQMPEKKMKESYGFSVAAVGMVSFGCLLVYYPLCIFVGWFLPNYANSLPIFRVLFPSITISSIISMIMINHFKALQKQNKYFVYSIIVLVISAILNTIAYLLTYKPISLSIASLFTMLFLVRDIESIFSN